MAVTFGVGLGLYPSQTFGLAMSFIRDITFCFVEN